ncbi:PREDICTED: E3 ubiquitin-protein ligase SINA-like 7 [Ipomoea nil]|uniref:E3 ubiquitin-protein ligase SINA-like 7 n=1 Tax=Ipomoea nil TaxID=35883 RepID=UPI000901179B|nr:PREDICTED: E3 ubiquitin-protein ligase SINA-like 7 [Ipomoea nil]
MKDMKNSSTKATIKGSSRANNNSLNKRSIAVTTRFSLRETPKKPRTTATSSKSPPQPAHHQEIEAEHEEDEEETEEEEEDDDYNEEEEEEEEMVPENEDAGIVDGVSNGVMSGKGKGSISATLIDPDVLDCPICFMSLTIPLFQCENGHIACASCCIKLINKCPSCASPIGFNRCRALEKVVESLKVPCPNNTYGCEESIKYNKLRDHEPTCIHTPCSCPNRACKFLGSSKEVYTHFTNRHVQAKRITFNSPRQISLKKNQRFIYLQEKTGGVVFVVNHHMDPLGSAVNVICIAPGSSKRRFLYKLVARGEEENCGCKGGSGEKTTSIKLEAVAENIPKWDPSAALKIFLLVPGNVISDSWDHLKLEVCIKDLA